MSPESLVDHRIYTIRLRRMGEFMEVFNRLATLAHPLGFYASQVGPLNPFVHLWCLRQPARLRATPPGA